MPPKSARKPTTCDLCPNTQNLHICQEMCNVDGAMVRCGAATCEDCLRSMFADGRGGSRVRRMKKETPEECPLHHAFAECECSDCETREGGPLTMGHFARLGAMKHVWMLCCGGCHEKTWEPCCHQVLHVPNPVALQAELKKAEAEGHDISDIPDGYKGCEGGFDAKLFERNGCRRLFCQMFAGTTQTAKPDTEFGEESFTSRLGPVFDEVFATAAGEELVDDAHKPEMVDNAAREITETFSDNSEEFTECSDNESLISDEFTKESRNHTDDEMDDADNEGNPSNQYADQYASSDEDAPLSAFLPQPVPSEGKRPSREKRNRKTSRWNSEFVNQERTDQTANSAPVHECSDDDDAEESVWDLPERVTIKATQAVLTAEEEERELLQTKEGKRQALLDRLDKEKEDYYVRRNELVLQAFGQKKGSSPSAKTRKRINAFCARMKIRIVNRYARRWFRELVPARRWSREIVPFDRGQVIQDYYDRKQKMIVFSVLQNVLSRVCD